MDAVAPNTSAMIGSRMRIQRHVGAALARLRIQEAIHAFQMAAAISACLLVFALLADRTFSLMKIGINVWVIWAGITALGIPYILWRVYSPRLHQQLAAVLADDRMGLNARLSTALTLDVHDPQNAAFGELFFAEAEQRLQKLDVTQAFPIRVPRTMGLLLIPIAGAAAIHTFMDYRDVLQLVAAQDKKRQAEERQKKVAAVVEKKLEDLKRTLEEHKDVEGGQFKAKQLIEQADKIANQLKEGERNPDEAMLALGQLKRDIQEQKEKLTQGKEFTDRLEKLSAKDLNLEEDSLTKDVSEALKMGNPELAAREMRRMAQEMKKDVLDNPNLTPEQKEKKLEQLRREVEKLAGALAEDEALKENLQELSEKAMGAAEFQQLQEEIKKEMNKKGKGNQKHGDDIEQKAEEVAQELERLAEDDDAALNENEEKEMEALNAAEEGLDEAMEGLAGAEQGQEGEKGEQGGEEMQGKQAGNDGKQGKQGNQGKAAGGKGKKMARGKQQGAGGKEGGQAGKQGGKGQGQQGDGKNQQGQPGQGLGGGKGQGQRPQGNVADPGFKAEKVKGQMRAGAISGLSHFRGQGAKGDAPVEFVQALEAADKESASSLELERVPADAREVVRDYFLKVRQGANMPTPVGGPKGAEPPAPPPAGTGPKKEALTE